MDLKSNLERLSKLMKSASLEGFSLTEPVEADESLFDFKLRKRAHVVSEVRSIVNALSLDSYVSDARLRAELDAGVNALKKSYAKNDRKSMASSVNNLLTLVSGIRQEVAEFSFSPKNLPKEIEGEVKADIEEMRKCYAAGCYRSVVILCARVLEVTLHRKHFDVTGVDLLEKSPGIGLGKIIQKLTENKVTFSPGLTQQIHLVNEVRIHAVHRQEHVFNPTKSQAMAVILLTKDIVEKTFS